MEPAACSLHRQPLESNLYIHFKAHKTTIIRRHPVAPMTQTHKFSPSNQVFGLSHCKLSCRFWKTSCSVSRLMSWSCWRSSCRSWSICPLQAMLDLLPWVLTGVPLQGSDTQLKEVWITSELLLSDKSILSFSQPYYCRLYGREPGRDLLVSMCVLDHFLSCIGEEGIKSMSSLDGLSQSSGTRCSRGSYDDSRNNTSNESS